ncbi:DUF4369 domain-containing protein [Paucihalobacter sp.]|uniref:DUF4369 domain-containing protein n=1 Tax=Paucihalobacter sp. TaxID=2850405 RepID=UPI002FE3219C
MRNLYLLLTVIAIFSCTDKPADLVISGTIEDLKKGSLYLEKFQDTTMVIIDSVYFNGDNTFKFERDLAEPEVLFLRLNKSKSDNNALAIFADKGEIVVNSNLKNFVFDAKVTGSEQQKVLEEYLKIMSRFNDKNLDLIQEQLQKASEDSTYIMNYDKQYSKLVTNKYLYTINFAINHKNSEVSPYLALTEIPDVNIKYLDTIYQVLTPKIRKSKYGVKLKETLDELKRNHN